MNYQHTSFLVGYNHNGINAKHHTPFIWILTEIPFCVKKKRKGKSTFFKISLNSEKYSGPALRWSFSTMVLQMWWLGILRIVV